MHRYIALLWDPRNNATQAEATNAADRLCSSSGASWRRVLNTTGTTVLCCGPSTSSFQAYLLTGNRGVVLGKLFPPLNGNSPDPLGPVLSEHFSGKIVESQARALIDSCWGRYIALVVSSGDTKCILRDPSGGIPCYFAKSAGLVCVFSNLDDYLALFPQTLNVNWSHLVGFMIFNRSVSAETGYKEITQLRAGECRHIDADGFTDRFYWSPVRICKDPVSEDPDAAMNQLRGASIGSVQSWGSCFQRILIELSGGFDSSGLVVCLKPHSDVICWNMYTKAPEGDERGPARRIAALAGRELIETMFMGSERSLANMLSGTTVPTPLMISLRSESEDFRAQIARDRRIEAVFTGRGGDQLFHRRRSISIAREYVHRHGIGKDLLAIVVNTARLTGNSVWSVLGSVLVYRLFPQSHSPYEQIGHLTLLHSDASTLARTAQITHPWVTDAAELPDSKAQQIFDVIDSQNYFLMDPCTYADVVPAYVTQPLMERVLRTPTYLLTIGGIERGLVRRAFATDLPPETVSRTVKGDASSAYLNLLEENIVFVRDFLLNGILASQHILDRSRTEAATSSTRLCRGADVGTLLTLVKAEQWLRTSQSGTARL